MNSAVTDDKQKRLLALDRAISELVFTDIAKARESLEEEKEILDDQPNPELLLNYHLNSAQVENQLYHYELAEVHFSKALEMLAEIGDANQLAEANIDYAGTLLNLEQMERAKFCLASAARYLEMYPDSRLLARLICRQGYLYLKLSHHPKAFESFLEAEKITGSIGSDALRLKDYYFITLTQSGLGSVYEFNNEPRRSVKAYQEVVKLSEEKKMNSRLSWHYLNVGKGFMNIDDVDSAIHYFQKAVGVIDDENQQARALAYANQGFCFIQKNMKEEALDLFEKAIPLFKEKKENNLANIEWGRARIYEESDAKRAMEAFFKALDYAKRGEDFKQISGILHDIATLYGEEGDFKNAYEYQVLSSRAVEKFLDQQKNSEIRELEIKYETERKEKEAEMFKLKVSDLQLKALRAQMNPHFVFNALNSVQNFITSNDSTQAAKYLAQFAKLMRKSLEYSELEAISLEREIDFLRNYLDINEKLRFENRLSYEINVDEEIEEDIYGVPTMIIQPYVENAIEHGIRMKKKGLIKVDFSLKDENTILCVIEDNGIGREKMRQLQESNPNHKDHRSLGTKITQERLEILLDAGNGKKKEEAVKIIDLVSDETGEALGTRVEVLIPIVNIKIK